MMSHERLYGVVTTYKVVNIMQYMKSVMNLPIRPNTDLYHLLTFAYEMET